MNHKTRHLPQAATGRVRQTGVATLMMSAVLLLLLTILSFTAARVGIQQQRLAGTDMRTREVREASEAGLEYALAWLRDNKCNLASCDPGVCTTNCFPTLPAVTLSSGYSYTPAVSFSMQGGLLLVASTAVAAQDNTITNTVQQVVRQTDLLTEGGRNAPPIVVDGCLSSPGGNPTIYPRPGGTAVLTLATNTPGDGSSGSCIDLDGPGSGWKFDLQSCLDANSDPATCTWGDTGVTVGEANFPNYIAGEVSPLPEPTAWNHIFNMSLAEAKAQAAAAGQVYADDNLVPTGPGPDVPFIHYTDSNPFNGSNPKIYGSPERPVVIIVSHPGCPTFNGGVTIFGFVYYEAPSGSCNGWGGANVIGSVVLEDDASDFNANTEFFDVSNLEGGGNDYTTVLLDDAARALGAWKDW